MKKTISLTIFGFHDRVCKVRIARHYKNKLSAKKNEWLDWRVDRLQVETKRGMLKIVDKEQTGSNKGSLFNFSISRWSSSNKKLAEDACLAGGKTTLGHKLLKDADEILEAMDKAKPNWCIFH